MNLKKIIIRSDNGAYAWKGNIPKVMMASRPEFSSDQMAESVPEIIYGFLYKSVMNQRCLVAQAPLVQNRSASVTKLVDSLPYAWVDLM
jgi:hypothetical protein